MFIFFDQKVKQVPCSETGTRHGARISSKAYIQVPLGFHDVMMQTLVWESWVKKNAEWTSYSPRTKSASVPSATALDRLILIEPNGECF